MERRSFIKQCTVLCIGSVGFSFLMQSCGAVHYASFNMDAQKIKVKKSEFTDSKNQGRKFIVIRTPQLQFPICVYKIDDDFTALYMQCTHQGCELHPNKVSLVCPCHGSEFTIEGKVQSPPADKNLTRFNVSSDNENIYIEI